MKTLVLWCDEDAKFFELEGDYHHLDGIWINSGASLKLEDELFGIVYNAATDEVKVKLLDKPTKDWDFFIDRYHHFLCPLFFGTKLAQKNLKTD